MKKGLSLPQNIDAILFAKEAPLREEFKYLYASVFKKPDTYVKLIETLGAKRAGMTRDAPTVINLCEMKYSGSEYTVTEKVERSIRNKMHDLVQMTGTKYAVHPTLITTYGLVENSYAANIQSVVVMDDLFAPD